MRVDYYIKIVFLFFVFILVVLRGWSCDACGCSAGGNYMGVLPLVQNHLIGYKYQYQNFTHPVTSISSNGEDLVSKDLYQSSEIWGRYSASNRVHLFAFLPIKRNVRQESVDKTTLTGVGDIQFMGNYNALIRDADSLTWKHFLRMGALVQMPTGKYMQRDANKAMLPLWFQLGSGSWALGLKTAYTLRYKRVGLNLNAQYRFYSKNELDYTPGKQLFNAAQILYWYDFKKATLIPQVGLSYESFGKDVQYATSIPHTGGGRWSFSGAVDCYYRNYLVSVFSYIPMVQNIPSEQPNAELSLGVTFAYFLN
jgi:hypothetical protein